MDFCFATLVFCFEIKVPWHHKSDKLTFIYLEMPKFNKSIEELETRYDKWLFVLKNLHRFDKRPEKLKEKIFLKLFKTAEIAKFSPDEFQNYENSLKYYRDLKNSLDTAKEEGRLEEKIKIDKVNTRLWIKELKNMS